MRWIPVLLAFAAVSLAPSASACTEAEPCPILVHATQDGLYFQTPGTTAYNVTQGDWHQLDVFSDHGESHKISLEHYGVSVRTSCFDCPPAPGSQPPPPSVQSRAFVVSDPGEFAITDEQTGQNITLRVAINDVTDIEAGEDPVTGTQGGTAGDNTREVPGFGAIALLGALSLAVIQRR